MRSEREVNQAIDKYVNLITRICFLYLKNEADTQDVLQSVFLKYLKHDKPFESEEHEKAWFIRVSINACKDILKNFFHSHIVSLDKVEQFFFNRTTSASGSIGSRFVPSAKVSLCDLFILL